MRAGLDPFSFLAYSLATSQELSLINKQALLPSSIALLHREDSHERFHCVDFAVVDFERLPNRELVTAALAHASGHA
jgi:hypothetical protein